MAYQDGVQALTNGQQSCTVIFNPPFQTPPTQIIPIVQNTSGDSVKFLITANPVAVSETGFTVELDNAPNSDNYVLAWIAGSAETLFEIISSGVPLSAYPAVTQVLDTDYLMMVHTYPVPATQRLLMSTLKAMFPNVVSGAPGNPNAPGVIMQVAIDASALYVNNGIQWCAIPFFTNWGTIVPPPLINKGQFQIPQSTTTVNVPFGTTYDEDELPDVHFNFMNTVDGVVSVLTGILTGITTTGFTITINQAVTTNNYYLVWTAFA